MVVIPGFVAVKLQVRFPRHGLFKPVEFKVYGVRPRIFGVGLIKSGSVLL